MHAGLESIYFSSCSLHLNTLACSHSSFCLPFCTISFRCCVLRHGRRFWALPLRFVWDAYGFLFSFLFSWFRGHIHGSFFVWLLLCLEFDTALFCLLRFLIPWQTLDIFHMVGEELSIFLILFFQNHFLTYSYYCFHSCCANLLLLLFPMLFMFLWWFSNWLWILYFVWNNIKLITFKYYLWNKNRIKITTSGCRVIKNTSVEEHGITN